ncbi:hypothetical protein QOZ80_3BG0272490 [Eleusine coracana subsp. coracana]|nr:hypothetical protein QOZ80_3BG0272490 [Eleusine coracana subsp. coracana]
MRVPEAVQSRAPRRGAAEPSPPPHLPPSLYIIPPPLPIPPQNLAAMPAASSSAVAAPNEDQPPPCDPQTLARWYQLEALERAVRGNTLAFLETGAGKTLIAVLLLRAYAHRIRRGPGPGPRSFAVFLVPTVVLVGQQTRVIEAHTDLRVAQFYGEMGVDFWSADTWRAAVEEAEVLVMTPQILLDNLRHSFFRLRDIALLIFDECHNATGNSPYACILKEFYHPQLNSRPSDPIPRIFGMTASLVNSKGLDSVHFSKQISELENLMNSKVYTVDNESALSKYIPFAATKIVQYDDSSIPSELHDPIIVCLNKLKTKYLEIFEAKLHNTSLENAKQRILKLHQTFSYCIANLGVWLAAKAAEVLSRNERCVSFWGEKLDEQVEGFVKNYSEEVYKDLSHFSKRDHVGEDFAADLQDGLLTSKVHFLIKSLLEYRHMQDLRCIVFVERVITSIVLQSLLSSISHLSRWNVTYMAGNKNGLHSQNRTKHMEIVDSFRSGKVHLIIATNILEEGLDVPSCNLVVRFDPSATVCSFIQSRGRARMQNSDYVLLVRRGDVEALSKTEKFLSSGQMMREESLRLAPAICQPLENTLCDEEYYCVESTGALVTLNSSVPLIYFFCSKLPSDEYFKPLPRFVTDKALGTCTLHLPKSSPVHTVHAEGEDSVLKQLVCLKACRKLHAVGTLTDYLLPELGVPYEDEPDIVMETYKQEQPEYFPEQLLDNWFSFSRHGLYYCYKISLDGNLGKATSSADIILAVKCDMGSDFIYHSFKLWGVHGDVNVTITFVGIIHLTEEQVIIARRFQTTILSLLISNDHSETKDVPFCSCMLKNSVVCTPHNSIFYVVSGFLELNANSLMNQSDVSYKTHFDRRYGLDLTYEEQPLLFATKLWKSRNFLHKRHDKKEKANREYEGEEKPETEESEQDPLKT